MAAVIARMALWVALAFSLPAWAQAISQPTDAQVKAAFLYKFGDFVDWPPGALPEGRAFTIGVLGADAVADALEQIVAGRAVQNRPVIVRRLRLGESLAGVHVLFVGASRIERLGEVLAQAGAVLVVTDAPDGLERGGVINFVPVDRRLRFDVALGAAGRMHLRISARLLAVARRVVPG